ncbi:MAG TPA: PE-PPE domain-containing protein [Mycobacterium sp.]
MALVGPTAAAPPPPAITARTVQLTGVDSAIPVGLPLGGGTALIMGGSGDPIPSQRFVDAYDSIYLQPNGFTGSAQPLATPEGLYPFVGVKTLPFDTSVAQGQQALYNAITQQISGGHVDAANPVVVAGLSQSSTVASQTMTELAAHGVPSEDVRFVLTGDPSNPDGGLLERFDVPIDGQSPTVPALGITFSGATPSDLYPADIYTAEYDGFADWPRYPSNLLADLNALLGIAFQHSSYPVLTPEQVTPMQDGGTAMLLPGSAALTGEGLTNYVMIPDPYLPLLEPLLLIPGIGKPLYDLLEPDARILVNTGYGSITQGWDPGPANVPTTFGVSPDIDQGQLSEALSSAWQHGVADFTADLQHPASTPPLLDNPVVAPLVQVAYTQGLVDTPHPSILELLQGELAAESGFPISHATLLSPPIDIINDLTATLSADYSALLPIADTANTVLTTVPAVLAGFVSEQLQAGAGLGETLGEALAAGAGLLPFLAVLGLSAPGADVAGTLTNLAQLFNIGHVQP